MKLKLKPTGNMSFLLFLIPLILSNSCEKDKDIFIEAIIEEDGTTADANEDEENANDNGDASLEGGTGRSNDESNPSSDDEVSGGNIIRDDVIASELKAFPLAEGYGKYASGGRGGRVLKVTNLNDSGSGSLRSAIEASGPRIVIFETGGHINLTTPLNIVHDDITIAGQSAPGEGIMISLNNVNGPVIRNKASNVIIRYLSIRHSDASMTSFSMADGIYIAEGRNIMIDHCSVSWASDEQIAIAGYSGTYIENVTIQNCIIGPGFKGSNKGALVTGEADKVTFYRNYFASNSIRNPRIACDVGNCPNRNVVYEVVNNVVYDAKNTSSLVTNEMGVGLYQLNFIKNYSKQKNGYGASRRHLMLSGPYKVKAYVKGNIDYFRTNASMNEWETTGSIEGANKTGILGETSDKSLTPFNSQIIRDRIPLLEAQNVWEDIRNDVGASFPSRNSYDALTINDYNYGIQTFKNEIQTFPRLNEGFPQADFDNDGIPDAWEIVNGFDPNVNDSARDTDGDGYTNIEEFLNMIVFMRDIQE